ncbi:MAG: RsmE family RNA methyltransferase [Anaerosomatales bacterium]|nr:RsmE family RNA methyltransferase [Anaerosomatales bacterium]
MTLHRFFVSEHSEGGSGPIRLSDADAHHVLDVLRLGPGDSIVCVDPAGVALEVRITRVDGGALEGEAVGNVEAAPVPRVWLVQGLAKGEKMDAVVRQATELGVERIVPLSSSRSVVRLDGAKAEAKRERWQRVAREAAKQSQRASVPEVAPVASIAALGAELGGAALVLVAWEDASNAPSISQAIRDADLAPEDAVAVVVGPEGGFSAEEVADLVAAGARTVWLGPTILRTETAGVVASALALSARGGLGGE